MQQIKVTIPPKKQEIRYPSDLFESLNTKCKQLVYESYFNVYKSFLVGKFTLEGLNNFPQNIKIGLQLIENSMKRGSTAAYFYYIDLHLRKNEYISQNIRKAEQLIRNYPNQNDSNIFLLRGFAYRLQNKLDKAFQNIEQAAKLGNTKAIYYYAKMLYFGDGCQKCTNKADQYFELAKQKGVKRTYPYLRRHDSRFTKTITNSPYNKGVDIVFMIDRKNISENPKYSLESLSTFCYDIISQLWEQYPNIYFRFGVVFNSIGIEKTQNTTRYSSFHFLTKKRDEIKNFLINCIQNDDDIIYDDPGYKYLPFKFRWDDNAEKIVIHIADSSEKNLDSPENCELNYMVQKLAFKNISVFCLNLNSNEAEPFKMTKMLYEESNGKNFVVQNHFDDFNYDVFDNFVSNAVASCLDTTKNEYLEDNDSYYEDDDEYDINDEKDGLEYD